MMEKKENLSSNYFRMTEAELIKLRHSMIWFAVISIPIISIFIGTGSFTVNRGILQGDPWFDLWTQVALFYGYFFYPLALSVIASYLFRLEHFGTNWNLIKTLPQGVGTLWFSKLTILFLMAVLIQIILVILYFISGFLLHLPGNPPTYFWWWLIAGPITVMAPGSFCLLLSSRIKSFSIPVAIEFVCCFIGLACYAQGFWFFPNTLAIIGINAQHEGIPSLIEMIEAFGGTFFWITIFSVLGIYSISRKED